ncbi:MAG TPA: hypothetical protein ENH63_06740 [Sulfitobacter litoralis]|uniref:Uncharacterized protein n=2 Tax=root TaxID=1 RepID=A0A7V1BDX1_9RHOB|nr:hypothetical protein [Sulfitobacter litoralis]
MMSLLVVTACLAAPVGYIEVACRPDGQPHPYASILPESQHRAEGRTLLTYPEWHIVHAYEEYAEVIRTDDPHDFDYLRSIGGFWGSLCSLSEASGPHGGFPASFKQTIYTIGVSFTAEMLAKAAYEETVGRAATWMRGEERATLDRLSASQARSYSHFLRQVPWYKWDFRKDALDLSEQTNPTMRDTERRIFLGLEYKAKAQYAKLISAAVANMEPDALRLRMIVKDINVMDLGSFDEIKVIQRHPVGIEIETPRYRALTDLLQRLAMAGASFVEIAGNDDILYTAIARGDLPGALYSTKRQGFDDQRHLVLVRVSELAEQLKSLESRDLTLEHIHDY